MVEALVEARHTLGSEHRLRARTKLAVDLEVSEQTVRNWLSGTTPRPPYAKAVRDLYHRENPDAE